MEIQDVLTYLTINYIEFIYCWCKGLVGWLFSWHIKKPLNRWYNKYKTLISLEFIWYSSENPLRILYMVKTFPLTVKEETWWGIKSHNNDISLCTIISTFITIQNQFNDLVFPPFMLHHFLYFFYGTIERQDDLYKKHTKNK